MSITVMTHVWKDAPVCGTELLMLLALADSANDDFECYPSIAHLAHKVRCSEKQVKRLLKSLERQNVIEIVVNGAIGRGHVKPGKVPNLYRITPDEWRQGALETGDAHDPSTGDAHDPSTGDAHDPSTGDAHDPLNHHIEPSVEPSISAGKPRKSNPLYDAVSAVWHSEAGGYVGNILSMLQGTAKRGEWKRCNFDPPVTDAAEILAFGDYARRRMKSLPQSPERKTETVPTACVTIQRWFYDFREAQAAATQKAAAKIIPIVPQAEIVPILLQRQQEVDAALLREAQ